MALILADRVKESTTTTGTSDFALGGAVTGFQSFATAVGANNTTYYAIADGADWEVGLGTLSSDGLTLVRTTVYQSSNSDTKVSFASGTKQIFVTYAADKAVFEDASGNVTLPANLTVTGGSTTDSVQLDLTAGVTPAVGQIAWDAAQGTATLGLLGGNVLSRLGQTLVAYVTNAESTTITKGQAVYLFGAQGDRATVKLANNTGDATSAKTLGIVAEDITANGTGFVVCQGVVYGLDLSAYTAGDTIYLGATAGALTATKPYAPNHLVYLGVVEKANAGAGQLYVRVQNGYELDELHNVSAQSPSNGQTIVFNTSTSLWEKNTVSLTIGVNGTLPPANGGTGITSLGSGVATFLGTPSSANLAAAVTDETGTGALVFANSPTLVTPALGIPSSATLTNATGLPISTGVSGLGTGVATFLATPSSANLKAALTDETGSGAAVFATSPTLVTPALGTPSSATLTNATGLPIASGVSGLGTGIATALAVNVGTSGAPVINGGALGTPSSGTVTNLTGTASININGTVGATTPSTGNFTTLNENSVAVVTQSDIGTGANEIPLNQYLGSLAYQNGDAYYNTGMTVGFRNRIINGAMTIDQRNAGASVAGTGAFAVDRFRQEYVGTGVLTAQQSTDAPVGFTNSLKFTVSTADSSVTSSEYYQCTYSVEGNSVSDFNLGTSTGSTMTLSLWVKGSQTGSYSIQLANSDGSRCFSSFVSINTANTWEYKIINVPAPVSGTFNNGTGIGLGLRIGFAYGSSFTGATANTWGTFSAFANSFVAPTNNMLATSGATFQVTGVQLEKGNIATSFDVRPYGTELALCQRYCQVYGNDGADYQPYAMGVYTSGSVVNVLFPFFQKMRASPTMTVLNPTNFAIRSGGTLTTASAVTTDLMTPASAFISVTSSGSYTTGYGSALLQYAASPTRLTFSAEL